MEIVNYEDNPKSIIEFDRDTISKIILEFLGNKETLSFKKEGEAFLLRHNDLAQFHYLLEQKLSNQKDVLTLHLTVDIHYNNGDTRTINDINSFEKINEINNLLVKQITLTWKIINKFHGHKHIETQIIELSFVTSSDKIIFNITHTNQSWALEILSLFKEKIDEITISDSRIIQIYKSISKMDMFNIIFTYFFILLISFLIISKFTIAPINVNKASPIQTAFDNYKVTNNKDDLIVSLTLINSFKNKQALELLNHNNIIESNSQKKLSQSLDKEIDKSPFKTALYWVGYLFIFFILPPVIFKYYPTYAVKKLRKPSYIIINPFMEKNHENHIESMKNISFYGVTTFSFSILTGIIACIIYDFFK